MGWKSSDDSAWRNAGGVIRVSSSDVHSRDSQASHRPTSPNTIPRRRSTSNEIIYHLAQLPPAKPCPCSFSSPKTRTDAAQASGWRLASDATLSVWKLDGFRGAAREGQPVVGTSNCVLRLILIFHTKGKDMSVDLIG